MRQRNRFALSPLFPMLEHDSSREIEDVWSLLPNQIKVSIFGRLSVSQEIKNTHAIEYFLILVHDAESAIF